MRVAMRVADERDLGASAPRVTRVLLRSVAPAPAPHPHDRVAFERAVLPCRPALRACALSLTKNRADAEDLLQETLLRAWRFWSHYREQDNCRAWLQRIMTNTFCSERRSRTRRSLQLVHYAHSAARYTAPADDLAGEQPHRDVSHEQLACSLSALRPEQRRILQLVDVDEQSYRETAQSLGCPIGTVMSRLHRARAALRNQIAREARASAP